MKTVTMLSMAIATALATHLALAAPGGHGGHGGHSPGMFGPEGKAHGDCLLGTVTFSTKHQAKIDEIFATFDLTQDGKITQDEVQAVHTDKFTSMDADGNGFLSFEEFQAGEPSPPTSSAITTTTITTATTEGDSSTATTTTKHKPGMGGHFPFPGSPNAATMAERKTQFQQMHFNHLDSDADGQISETEFLARLPLFDKLDLDEDGILLRSDFEVAAPCQVTQPTEDTSTTVVTPTTEEEGTEVDESASEAVEEPVVEDTITAETTVTQPTVSAGHGGGAACSTCH